MRPRPETGHDLFLPECEDGLSHVVLHPRGHRLFREAVAEEIRYPSGDGMNGRSSREKPEPLREIVGREIESVLAPR